MKIVLLFIIGAIASLLVYAATRPNHFRIVRSRLIALPPQAIFPHIDRLRLWQGWSPWEGLDPALKRDYSGPEAGVGAAYGWSGNGKAGQGRMEIVESAPHEKIVMKLDFVRPFSAHNRVTFTLTPEGEGTLVEWAMDGPQPFMAKLIGVVMNMDRIVGRDFERGLAALAAAAAASSPLAAHAALSALPPPH